MDQCLPGAVIQYESYVEPLASPANIVPGLPTGVAAWAIVTPTMVLRRALLPEQGSVALPTLTPEVSGAAHNWVPVYSGLRGLKPAQMPYTDALLVPFIPGQQTTLIAPTIQVYPDRLVRQQWPNTGTDFVSPWVPIAPPAPPTAKLNPFPNLYRRWFLLDMRN